MSKKIMLACAAGLSTSIMVKAMQKAALENNLDYEIWAEPVSTAFKRVGEVDAVLLGPQVRFELKRFKTSGDQHGVFVDVIEMKAYGMMNGKLIIDQLKEKLQSCEKSKN